MKKKLGLDLGTNSLGWGIVTDDGIEDCGVVVFEQGIPMQKGSEAPQSPAADRTALRAARRLKFRRRLRKYHTLKLLIENGMCPLSSAGLQKWIKTGKFPASEPSFISWLNSSRENNPYYFRAKAASELIPPWELGRALFHIAIRRGFKSSKKDGGTDDKETGEVKGKIANLKEILDKTGQTLGQYLYEQFSHDVKIRGDIRCGRVEHYIPEFKKICEVQKIPEGLQRKLYHALFMQRPLRSQKHLTGYCPLEKKNRRCLIAHPLFERYRMLSFINTIQIRLENEGDLRVLSPEERRSLEGVFLYKSPTFKFERLKKHLIKNHFRGQNPEFNYRDDQTVASSSLTYRLQEIMGCDDLFSWHHDYIDRKGKTKRMDYQAIFDGIKYFSQDYDDDAPDAFGIFATERLGLSPEKAAELEKIKVPSGYARYSLKAIRKIVPFLEEGYIERYAVYLAKLPDIFGEDFFISHKAEILADFGQCVKDYLWEKENLSDRERFRLLPLSDRFKQLLEEKWKIAPEKRELLYDFREPSNYEDCPKSDLLPRIKLGMLYNPMAHRSLTVMRHLVNYLRVTGKIDESTEIHVELAREVNDKNHRCAWREYQKQNEKERQNAIRAFAEHGIPDPTDEQIMCWMLWEEQNHICLYTGRKIESGEIFRTSEHPTVDIEHTIPRSMGGHNGRENLTLCDSKYNRDVKIGKLPVDCPNYESPTARYEKSILDNLISSGLYQNWEEAEKNYAASSARAKSASPVAKSAARQKMLLQRFTVDYWRNKMKTFEMKREDVSQFSKRQLAATGIMSRHALQFLKSTYPSVYANSGTITAFAREAWGLKRQYEVKDRSDHTHHALDAIVVAALDRRTLSKISAAFHEDELNRNNKDVLSISYPWKNFPADVHNALENIFIKNLMKHNETKQTKKNNVHLASPIQLADGRVLKKVKGRGDTVRGALHDQTYYGCILDKSGNKRYVLRKPLNADNFSNMESFEKIVDVNVRQAVIEQMSDLQRKASVQGEKFDFKTAMDNDFRMKTKSGKFDGPVIRRVRVFCDNIQNPIRVKAQTYVSPKEHKQYYYADTAKGSNFMVALYLPENEPTNTRRYRYELVSLWDWAREHRQSDYVPMQKRQEYGRFVGFINPGVSVLFYKNSPDELRNLSKHELQKRFYKVTEFKKDGRIELRWHREARAKKDVQEDMKAKFNVTTSSKLPFEASYFLLSLSARTYQGHTLFEGIDFDVAPDGQIRFREETSC